MYQQTVSRTFPGLVVFMIDRSDSMWRTWAGTPFSLAEGAARAVNRILFDLCIKSTKEVGAPLRDYFYVGVYGYGLRPDADVEGVGSLLPGALGTRGIVRLSELAEQPLRIAEELSADQDTGSSRLPVWVEPAAGYETPACEAVAFVGEHVYQWSKAFPDSFPPIIINITDGLVTDSPYQDKDLVGWAERLRTISTSDGSALLFNAFLSAESTTALSFPVSRADVAPPCSDLFAMSSPLPEPLISSARMDGFSVQAGARGLVINTTFDSLVRFLETGTRVSIGHD